MLTTFLYLLNDPEIPNMFVGGRMHKSRINTLQAILAGTCIGTAPVGSTIQAEFLAVHQAGRIKTSHRRRILEILHSARALDSALKAFIQHHGCHVPGQRAPNTMGGYLHALEKHRVPRLGQINATQRTTFQTAVADKRNTFLHEAGTFPISDIEVATLLSDMHACLTTVVAL